MNLDLLVIMIVVLVLGLVCVSVIFYYNDDINNKEILFY